MDGTIVRDAMTPSPRTVSKDSTAAEAAQLMSSEDVGSLPVVDGVGLVGIVTDRDLVVHVVAKDLDPHKITVADICSDDPVVASPDEPLDEALRRMAVEQVRRLPIVADGRLVGILAQADVAKTAESEETGRLVEEISED